MSKSIQQNPTLSTEWANFLNARRDIIIYLREHYGYSNFQLSQTLNTEIEAIDVIVREIEAEESNG